MTRLIPTLDTDTGKLPDSFIAAVKTGTARASVVYIDSYFSANRVAGSTDDTAALRNAITAAAGKTLVIGANTLRIFQNVEIISGLTIDMRGGTINCVDDGSTTGVGIWAHDFSGLTWLGGTLLQTAASRTSVYGVLRIERVNNVLVDSLTVNGGSSCGVFVIGGQYHQYRSVSISNTKADGIHISRGSSDIQILNPTVVNSGDDGIGIVAITTEPTDSTKTYPVIKRVVITDPIITGLTAVGGGVSFVGSQDCTLRGGIIDTVPTGGVKVTNDSPAGAPQPAINNSILGTVVKNARNGYSVGVSTDTQITGGSASSCSDSGISVVGATRLLVSGGKYRGNAGFGFYEASGTSNNIIGADLRGNTAGAFQASSAVQTSCITA
jgi:hypothetical protein